MKVAIVLSCVIAVTVAAKIMTKSSTHLDYEWDAWKAKFGKSYYEEKEEAIRRDVWEKNLKFVDQHNKETRQGLHSFTVGMNKFADLESEEFARIFLSRKESMNTPGCINASYNLLENNYGSEPKRVDWRTKGYVTGVKNQGACGSCWAFSATGSLEGQHFHKTGQLVSLSEQNLMDCSRLYGDFSCEGGFMDSAFKYIIDNKGIATEDSYPYKATDENNCKFKTATLGATMTSCVDVTPHGDEEMLKKAVADIGPVSVAIDASQQSFHLYKEGVYANTECSSTVLDHGVLAVGYGTSDEGKDYWLVKNSWGADWGTKGYIMMSRNKNNQCGIATSASYPVV